MFGFGYALVPLYDVFCDITGLNGKTGRLTAAEARSVETDETRLVTVEFVTNVNGALPWDFRPTVARVQVHPGSETEVTFEAVNRAQVQVTGHAVPSVAPGAAARYFSKTECFCFTRQRLEPGESREMPVRFVVDPKLPANIEILTLAYTFFEAEENAGLDYAVREPPRS
jgi:cytochrome c oxidase assembly protein subunit 11